MLRRPKHSTIEVVAPKEEELRKTTESVFMFVPCINSIKALFYYSKLMHTIIKL
jgi:hypothetical protein